jgi:hypothetical protein
VLEAEEIIIAIAIAIATIITIAITIMHSWRIIIS